jgi:hypothetical protein
MSPRIDLKKRKDNEKRKAKKKEKKFNLLEGIRKGDGKRNFNIETTKSSLQFSPLAPIPLIGIYDPRNANVVNCDFVFFALFWIIFNPGDLFLFPPKIDI